MGPYVPAAWRTGREGMVELPMLAPFAEPTAIAEFMEVAEQAEMSGLEPSAAAQPVAAPNDSLPWINAFLAATPVEPLAAIPASNDAVVAQVPEATPAADEIRALSDAIDSRDALPTTPTATASTDEWPLEEAASSWTNSRISSSLCDHRHHPPNPKRASWTLRRLRLFPLER